MLTRNGIAYNLNLSPYRYDIKYSNGEELTFKFSSLLYKDKFKSKMIDNRKAVNESLTKKFGFCIENDVISDIKLYSTIEKRGFLILSGEGNYTCLNTIKLDGLNKIHKK